MEHWKRRLPGIGALVLALCLCWGGTKLTARQGAEGTWGQMLRELEPETFSSLSAAEQAALDKTALDADAAALWETVSGREHYAVTFGYLYPDSGGE